MKISDDSKLTPIYEQQHMFVLYELPHSIKMTDPSFANLPVISGYHF